MQNQTRVKHTGCLARAPIRPNGPKCIGVTGDGEGAAHVVEDDGRGSVVRIAVFGVEDGTEAAPDPDRGRVLERVPVAVAPGASKV